MSEPSQLKEQLSSQTKKTTFSAKSKPCCPPRWPTRWVHLNMLTQIQIIFLSLKKVLDNELQTTSTYDCNISRKRKGNPSRITKRIHSKTYFTSKKLRLDIHTPSQLCVCSMLIQGDTMIQDNAKTLLHITLITGSLICGKKISGKKGKTIDLISKEKKMK